MYFSTGNHTQGGRHGSRCHLDESDGIRGRCDPGTQGRAPRPDPVGRMPNERQKCSSQARSRHLATQNPADRLRPSGTGCVNARRRGNHRPPTTAVRRGSFQWRPARRPAETDQPPLGMPSMDRRGLYQFYLSGRSNRKSEPLPGWLCTSTAPPWVLAKCFTMERPRPVPPNSLERFLSTR